MKRPAFQFYPGDWQRNAKLRRCTKAERGSWIDVLCLLHDSEEYGVLRWPLAELAQAAGSRFADLRSLRDKGVLKGADVGETCSAYTYTPRHAGKDGEPVILVPEQVGPIWYSSRMVRDEYVRTRRGIGTRFGEEPKVTPTQREGDGASSSFASSTSKPVYSGAQKRPNGNGETPEWFKTDEGIDAKGKELQIPARPGETYPQYKRRLFSAINGKCEE